MAYKHGITFNERLKGPKPVEVVRTGVIGLVGCSPSLTAPRQTLDLVLSDTDAAKYGAEVPGFNIPEALNLLLNFYQAAPILVVNVFDPATNLVTVTSEAATVGTGGKFKLAYAPIDNLVITTSGGSPVTLVKGTDYTVDAFGNVQILTRSTYPDATNLVAGYKRFDPTTVNASQIIGAVDGNTNVRTGMKLFYQAYNSFGFKAKVLIAPRYSTLSAVANELEAQATAFKGETYIDAPIGTTPQGAINGRGPSGSINFNRSNDRVGLAYPHLYAFNPDTQGDKLVPYSIHLAGLRNQTDRLYGFWESTSNRPLRGITGIERAITWEPTGENTEANLLNEVGIITVANGFGTPFHSWGLRSSNYPQETHPKSFLEVRRTFDTIYDSLERAVLPYVGRKIIPANIDEIRQTCQQFMNRLIGLGALVIGSKCTYDPAKNTADQLALGKITFTLTMMGTTPAENIIFDAVLDINLLSNLSKV